MRESFFKMRINLALFNAVMMVMKGEGLVRWSAGLWRRLDPMGMW